MSEAEASPPAAPPPKRSRKLILIALPALLVLVAAGVWWSGMLRPHPPRPAAPQSASQSAPVFVDVPEMIANLNVPGRRVSFVKLTAKLEVSKPGDQPIVVAAMPRIVDLMQTYLRETRPDELRGAAGTYRLREELINRADIAVAPARVTDILFTELLIQ